MVVNGVAYQHVDIQSSLMIWLYAIIVTLAVVVMFVTLSEVMGGSPAAATGVTASATVAETSQPAAALPPSPQPAILDRVPLRQRSRLIALIVEDHYVDIVTDKGRTLVLMRLADAIREAAPVPGLQVHRSHWVAFDAVVRAQRSEGKVMLELSNGMRLPVSRGFLPAAKDAGLVL